MTLEPGAMPATASAERVIEALHQLGTTAVADPFAEDGKLPYFALVGALRARVDNMTYQVWMALSDANDALPVVEMGDAYIDHGKGNMRLVVMQAYASAIANSSLMMRLPDKEIQAFAEQLAELACNLAERAQVLCDEGVTGWRPGDVVHRVTGGS
jgi:hypothetical protein